MAVKKTKNKNRNSGFTLLETLGALSVLILAVAGPLTLASYVLRSASVSQNRLVAFYLGQEAIEYVRNLRDSNAINGEANWLNGLDACISPNNCAVDLKHNLIKDIALCPKLKYDSTYGFYNCDDGSDSTFSRSIQLSPVNTSIYEGKIYEYKITVTTSWQERFGIRSFALEEHILNWAGL